MNQAKKSLIAAVFLGGLCALGVKAAAPGEQTEADWVDNRWNQMDSGRFQASVVPLPSGLVLKGLSIAVGGQKELTVCYDTQSGQLKGLWRGGLLTHNSRRFGVVNGSAPAAKPIELLPSKFEQKDASVRWLGHSLHNDRLVLQYESRGRKVLESPWWEEGGKLGVLTRTFEVQAGDSTIVLPLLEGQLLAERIEGGEGFFIQSIDASPSDQIIVVQGSKEALHLISDPERKVVGLSVKPSDRSLSFRVLIGDREGWNSQRAEVLLGSFSGLELGRLMKPGKKAWESLSTKGVLSRRRDAYAIDTLEVPYTNPWKSLMFFGGIDFLPNGDAAVCTLYGDVWIVKGIDESLKNLDWHRYATGLFQPLGLQVVDGIVYVLGRDQVTALHDTDGDSFADFYRNHSNLIKTQPGHNFVTSLQAADDGTLYYVDPHGLQRIAPDGQSIETIATGWRNPNGMGLSPDGILTVAPQQGAWTPSSQISEVKAGGYYGFGGPQETSSNPNGYDPPLCWIPHSIDNSGGSQVWTADSGWGPLSGQMIHLSYGRCSMMLVLRDVVDGQSQGGVAPLGGRFLSGAMRGAVNPKDGQVYVVGSQGWQTSALRDGSLQRVRYTGRTLRTPIGCKVHENGVALQFAEAVDAEWGGNKTNYAIEQWNYRYSKAYGSKDYSVADPTKTGRDSLAVLGVRLSEDRKSVFVETDRIIPVMQMAVRYNLRSPTGDRVRGVLYNTVTVPRPARNE